MDPIILTASDNGARITPAPGQAVVIRLPENPTTGFSWQVPDGAAVTDDAFAAPSTEAAGAAGERVITLAAGHAPATLCFGLARPWTKDAPEQEFTVHLGG